MVRTSKERAIHSYQSKQRADLLNHSVASINKWMKALNRVFGIKKLTKTKAATFPFLVLCHSYEIYCAWKHQYCIPTWLPVCQHKYLNLWWSCVDKDRPLCGCCVWEWLDIKEKFTREQYDDDGKNTCMGIVVYNGLWDLTRITIAYGISWKEIAFWN